MEKFGKLLEKRKLGENCGKSFEIKRKDRGGVLYYFVDLVTTIMSG